MERQFRWAAVVTAVLVAAVVGILSYNAGVAHGLAISPSLAGATVPYWAYRPWGWGAGWGPVFFLLFFWFVMFRMVAWGGFRRRWAGGPHDIPRDFDEWHRRAHEAMNKPL